MKGIFIHCSQCLTRILYRIHKVYYGISIPICLCSTTYNRNLWNCFNLYSIIYFRNNGSKDHNIIISVWNYELSRTRANMKCYKIINVFVNGSLSIMHVAIVILGLARPYLIYCDTHTRIQTKTHTRKHIYMCIYSNDFHDVHTVFITFIFWHCAMVRRS